MANAITLGGLQLEGFEVPEELLLGGRQRVAVHDLPGGGRVIDTLGPAEDAIVFSGVFSGAEAQARARVLDGLRLAGLPVSLSWNGNCRFVIVLDAAFDHAKPWWIAYRVQCLPCGMPPAIDTDASLEAIADLGIAVATLGGLASLAGATMALAASNAFTAGSFDQTAAVTTLSAASLAVGAQQEAAGLVLDGTDIGMVQQGSAAVLSGAVTAGQAAASLAVGGGYLSRSLGSLQAIGG